MDKKKPFFSIIIPTYNRPSQLATCLQALTHLDYPHDRFEVIVVDDGGKIPLEAVVAPFFDRIDVTLVTQKNAAPAVARNTGAAQAKGEFLAFTDDDCTPASGWLQTLAARFADAPDCAIGGRTLNALHSNPYSATSQIIIDAVYYYYNEGTKQARFFTSNNLAVPADRFRTIGGFNTNFATSEDREFCDRWLFHGYRMIYVPKALVYHAHSLTFHTFLRQHFYYGQGSFKFHQVRARREQKRVKLEPFSFYLNLVCYPFLKAEGQRALLFSALLVVSQVSSAMGFLVEWITSRARKRSRIGKD